MSEALAFDPEDILEIPIITPGDNEAVDGAMPHGDPPEDHQERSSVATELVTMTLEDYDLGITEDGDPFVVPKTGPQVALRLDHGRHSLEAELAARYFAETGRCATEAALGQAMRVVSGMAARTEPRPLFIRAATHENCIYVDIGDATGRAIEVTREGWSIRDSVPVTFYRTGLTGELATPVEEFSIWDLWRVLNVAEADQPLVLAWLLSVWMEHVPCPILAVSGEQGTGKSTASRILADLVDPSLAPLRRPPSSDKDWPVVASGSRLIALDNVSKISPALSDTLCRTCTGESDVRRRLYSNNDQVVYSYRRALLLNGIAISDVRGDLADRLVLCELRPIETRVTEEFLREVYAEIRGPLVHALLDLLAQVWALLPGIVVEDMRRMGDYMRVLAAVDQILGTSGLAHYRARLIDMASETTGNDIVLAAIAAAFPRGWNGLASQLAEVLSPHAPLGPYWPKSGGALSKYLTRVAPVARQSGWVIEEGQDRANHRKTWSIIPPPV